MLSIATASFASAAAALYRVPSAISYTISQLERDLGVAVFDRSGHRAVLTAPGELILAEGRRILRATQELGAAARRLADHWEPTLHLAVDALSPPPELWPAVAELQAIRPTAQIRIAEEVLGGTWEAVIGGRADLALGLADPPRAAGILQRRYRQVEFVFVCAPGHALADMSQPLHEQTLREHRAVIVADSAQRFEPRDGTAGLLDGQPRLTVATMQSKIEAIIHGLGVGYCPRPWVRDALAAGRLVAPTLATPRPPLDTFLLWQNQAPGRALQWFIDRLAADEATTTVER